MLRAPFCWQFYQIKKKEREGSVFCCGMWSLDRLKIEVFFIIGGKWVVQGAATD